MIVSTQFEKICSADLRPDELQDLISDVKRVFANTDVKLTSFGMMFLRSCGFTNSDVGVMFGSPRQIVASRVANATRRIREAMEAEQKKRAVVEDREQIEAMIANLAADQAADDASQYADYAGASADA